MENEPLMIVAAPVCRPHWKLWISTLLDEGFRCEVMDQVAIGGEGFYSDAGGIFLLDGMLPRLSSLIETIGLRCPAAQVVVVSQDHSFTIHHEAMRHGAVYISGIESPSHFIQSFRKAVDSGGDTSGAVLPGWV